jgi:DNA-binding response OmpR family regulator
LYERLLLGILLTSKLLPKHHAYCKSMKVLIVEDQQDLNDDIKHYLQSEGYICEVSLNYNDAEDKLLSFSYDCVILDIMLPDGNGLDLLRLIKKGKMDCSVLVVSAKNALDDKLDGLNLGADDYITKPFHLSELNARIKAIFRRRNLEGHSITKIENIEIDTEKMEVRVEGSLLDLTRKEYELLLYFVTNKNRVISRQSVAEHLWGDYTDNLDNFDFVYQHVKNLRKKISKAGGADCIETVYGLGYKMNSSVS